MLFLEWLYNQPTYLIYLFFLEHGYVKRYSQYNRLSCRKNIRLRQYKWHYESYSIFQVPFFVVSYGWTNIFKKDCHWWRYISRTFIDWIGLGANSVKSCYMKNITAKPAGNLKFTGHIQGYKMSYLIGYHPVYWD